MKTSKTHFEQIPVETVKKIAKELPENNSVENEDLSVETEDEGTIAQEPWRRLAQQAQHEQDPNKLIGLVKQLIATFDEEQVRKSQPLRPA